MPGRRKRQSRAHHSWNMLLDLGVVRLLTGKPCVSRDILRLQGETVQEEVLPDTSSIGAHHLLRKSCCLQACKEGMLRIFQHRPCSTYGPAHVLQVADRSHFHVSLKRRKTIWKGVAKRILVHGKDKARDCTPSIITASSVVSPASSGEPPYPTLKLHLSISSSQAEHPCAKARTQEVTSCMSSFTESCTALGFWHMSQGPHFNL